MTLATGGSSVVNASSRRLTAPDVQEDGVGIGSACPKEETMANWQTDGNAIGAGDFLGTTNGQPVIVSTAGTERLRVRSDGRVGVGLTDPRTQLHVLDRMATGLDHTSAGALTFFPPDGFAWFHIDNGPAGGRPIGRLRISHGNTPGAQELMTILQNGNVGIGRTDAAVKVHVTGDRLRLESGGRVLDLRADGGAVDVQSNTSDLYLHSAGGRGRNRVIINPFGGEGNVGVGTAEPQDKLHVAGAVRADDFLVTSDARLKTKVRPIRGALRALRKLRGVEFQRKDSGAAETSCRATRVGVIAQEVESVLPGVVERGAGDDYRGVNLSGMIGLLIEALKELDGQNEALRARIEALESGTASRPSVAAACG